MIDLFMFLCLRRFGVRLVYRVKMLFYLLLVLVFLYLASSWTHFEARIYYCLMINLLLSKEGITFLFAPCLFPSFFVVIVVLDIAFSWRNFICLSTIHPAPTRSLFSLQQLMNKKLMLMNQIFNYFNRCSQFSFIHGI